jgi:hypothetical protein
MMMTAEKPPKTGDFFTDPFTDPWAEWRPDWAGSKAPHVLQEKRAPTEPVTVRVTAEREVQSSRRRIVDARLWGLMSPAQQDSALEIDRAYQMMSSGLGYTRSDWQRVPGGGGGNAGEAHARLITAYVEWTKLCHKHKVSHSMILDVLVFGHALAQCDRDRRVRKGTSRANLLEGLRLYCKVKGWPAA